MARLPRLTLADHTHHLIQRGNNRQIVFADDIDRETMLGLLGENASRLGVALHAYVFMDNHFHLLATPSTGDGIAQWMQAVGRRYVRHFNDRHGRSGTLWEGRYRSTLIQTERYLLTCMAYLDLNPVRAGLVADASDWAWSSHRHYVGARTSRMLVPHPLYWELGNTPFAREARYAELVRAGINAADQARLTDATLHGWALGDDAFAKRLNEVAGRRVLKSKAGRRPLQRSG